MYKLISLIILALSAQAHADFTDNGNGTVTDNIRNLVWQQDASGEPRNHSMPNEPDPSAAEYCEKLDLAGLTGWRLPRIDELLTLLDYNHPSDSPSINPIFSGHIGYAWSSTIYAEDEGNRISQGQRFWLVDSRYGRTIFESNDVDVTNYYRCVHGDNTRSLKTSENMVIINRNIFKDPQHNLYWQRRPDKSILPTNLVRAQDYCTNLEIDEFQDWYLPSISELQTIIDYTRYDPALDTGLIGGLGIIHKAYWSNTPTVDKSWINWAFNLETGQTDQQDTTNYLDRNIGALCVRKGNTSDNPQPNMIIPIPEEGLAFTAPRVRFFNEDGSIQDYIVDFENVPNDDGELIFKVKAWRTIQ